MTDESPQTAPPPSPDKPSHSFQVTLPMHHYRYLTHLVRLRRGSKESDIAAHILIRELDSMFERGYHEKRIPAD
ncbi:MAG: hypothetical protein ACLQME_21230 [Alphaproteobacteria bacterium]